MGKIYVEFLNPRRPVRSWCEGLLQPESRVKNGLKQVRIYFTGSPPYYVWVNEENVKVLRRS